MRAFVAIDPPVALRETIARFAGRFRDSGARVSWVRPENMHLTIRFLGDVSEDDVVKLRGLLRERYAGTVPFTLQVHGAGAFPSTRRPSILWVGLRPLEGPLDASQRTAERAAVEIGLKPERRPFKPHLTIGRVRQDQGLERLRVLLEQERDFSADTFSVENVSLWKSDLMPSGPTYTLVEEFRF